ncbi:hypothetical protein ACE193_10235 [Bernardetia sp. OM2101]|uniref:hypothetical protein n=1 Tax=Bernardetia sp. OM2101 TaxID=3344876 RepID=UPI0035CEDA2C
MKIKVLVLFSVLFWGIGFEGFGQFPKSHRGLQSPKINADTVTLSLKERIKILNKKCEKVWVSEDFHANINKTVINACYTYKLIITDTLEDGTFGGYSKYQTSEVKNWIFIKAEKSKEIEYIIQPFAYGSTSEMLTTIWQRNEEGEFKVMKSWWGEMTEIHFRKGKLSVKVMQYGCCANDFLCEEVYDYENEEFIRKSQMCYLDRMEIPKKTERKGFIQTTDSLSLFTYSNLDTALRVISYRDASPRQKKLNELEKGAYACIKPNQKGEVFFYKKEENIYWYFVVFNPKSIERRMSDTWIAFEKDEIHLAGWIKSKTPLKIESE